jgi:hypothetical protein
MFWTSCSKKPESEVSVEVIDGVEFVHNTETPLFPDKSVAIEEDLSIAPEDEEGNILLFTPNWYGVDGKENLYISDFQEKEIKVFGPRGEVIRTIGREGSGPGEFQSIYRFMLLPDDRLLVLDSTARRISLFDTEGNFIGSHSFPNSTYNLYLAGPSFYVREDGTFGREVVEAWVLERILHIRAYDYAGEELFSYGDFVPSHSQPIDAEGRKFTISPKPFDVRSILAGDQQNNRLYHCLNDSYLIEVYDAEGKLFRKIDRPYQPLLVTEKDKQKYFEGFTRSSENDREIIEKYVIMPKWKTVTDFLFVDDAGNLWLKTFEEKEEEGVILTAYDIFNPDGYYIFRVWLEFQPGLFKKGKMYRMERDEETGYRTLKRYRVIWSD